MSDIKTIGILGAGKLGVTVAQLALTAGYKVYIAGSGDPEKIKLSTEIITPGAVAVTAEDAVNKADVVILALPLGKFRSLDPKILDKKLVVDGMNHWYEVDGPLQDIIPKGNTTSEVVQQYFKGAKVVKALNHMGYHNLRDEAKPSEAPERKAIAVAGDDSASISKVSDFVDSLGFDPIHVGRLSETQILETGQEAFGANLSAKELALLIK